MTVTHAHAVEVDRRLAAIWGRRNAIAVRVAQNLTSIHGHLGERGDPRRRYGTAGYWPTTHGQAEAAARSMIASPAGQSRWLLHDLAEILVQIDDLRAEDARLEDEAEPLADEYATERWPRFFLVQNTGGHIHREMTCRTTFPTTRWAWLPELSGLGEDAAVAAQGPRLCSVCFPSAPVEWTLGLPANANPARCPGSGQQATNISYRYQTPRGQCAVCGAHIAASSTGKARPHNTPKG